MMYCDCVINSKNPDYIEKIMNEETDWDHSVEGDAVEGPVDCAGRDEMVQALKNEK